MDREVELKRDLVLVNQVIILSALAEVLTRVKSPEKTLIEELMKASTDTLRMVEVGNAVRESLDARKN